jgi:SAM-dependent methyltransferase
MANDPRAFYDDLADDYHLILSDWNRSITWQSDVIDRLIGAELGNDRVSLLDCACGIGTQAIGLALRDHRVHATDLSPRSIDRARREATRLGASLTFGVADLRALSVDVRDTFDVVLAFDNALPHLLTEAEVQRAVAEMARRLCTGGLFLASIRDYDRILADPPPGEVPRLLGDGADRRIVFQLWDWAPDGLTYDLRLFILRWKDEGWETREHITRYRALRRDELTSAMNHAGLSDIRWLTPEESGYYQPIVLARKR